ncbi:MAG: YjbH domain-containing protein [Ignavibacteriales bacterium]|nr:YjbH domain-containing protein [Ignavibacteriales bacterium]
MNRKITTIVFAALLVLHCARGQSNAGTSANIEPTMIIDKPTAGMLHRGSYYASAGFFEQGGVLFGVSVGLIDRFNFGISYGGTDILGTNKPKMNPYPGVNVKIRVLDESSAAPAVAIGFEWQGRGPYLEDLKRYVNKSPGFYAVASQNYSILGNLSVHGGLNLSTESGDGDKDLNIFFGAEKSLGRDISLLGEYDLGLNDNSANAIGRDRGRGYLNLGVRWSWGKGLVLGVNIKDVLKNQGDISVGNRTLQLEYVGAF